MHNYASWPTDHRPRILHFNCHRQQSDDPLLSAGHRSGRMMTDTQNDLSMHIRISVSLPPGLASEYPPAS